MATRASTGRSAVNRGRGHGKKTGTSGERGPRKEPYHIKKGPPKRRPLKHHD